MMNSITSSSVSTNQLGASTDPNILIERVRLGSGRDEPSSLGMKLSADDALMIRQSSSKLDDSGVRPSLVFKPTREMRTPNSSDRGRGSGQIYEETSSEENITANSVL